MANKLEPSKMRPVLGFHMRKSIDRIDVSTHECLSHCETPDISDAPSRMLALGCSKKPVREQRTNRSDHYITGKLFPRDQLMLHKPWR